LTNTDVELQITSDHRVPQSILGLEDGVASIVGDLAIARYLVQRRSSRSSSSSSNGNERNFNDGDESSPRTNSENFLSSIIDLVD